MTAAVLIADLCLAFALGVVVQAFISTLIIKDKPRHAATPSDVKHWAVIGKRAKEYKPRRAESVPIWFDGSDR